MRKSSQARPTSVRRARSVPVSPADEVVEIVRPQHWYGSRDSEAEIAIDIDESDATYYLKADIPGAKKEDIDVAIAGDKVTISARVETVEVEQKGVRSVVRERVHGMRSRRIFLDADVDSSKATASFRDGVLSLSLPKKPGARGKSIVIS